MNIVFEDIELEDCDDPIGQQPWYFSPKLTFSNLLIDQLAVILIIAKSEHAALAQEIRTQGFVSRYHQFDPSMATPQQSTALIDHIRELHPAVIMCDQAAWIWIDQYLMTQENREDGRFLDEGEFELIAIDDLRYSILAMKKIA